MGVQGSLRFRLGQLVVFLILALAPASGVWAEEDSESGSLDTASNWFSQNIEVHGFLRTRFYARTPNFSKSPTASSMRNEINLEPEIRLYEGDDLEVSFYGVVRGIYEAVYDYRDNFYGGSPKNADFGTGGAYPGNQNAFLSGKGKAFPGRGGITRGEATILNSDTGSLFTGELTPAIAIDPVVFFGRVTAPMAARGGNQKKIGGNADGDTYADLRDNFGQLVGGLPAGPFGGNILQNGGVPIVGRGLDASLAMASMPLGAPLNFYSATLQKKANLGQSATDINAREDELKFDCFDGGHPYCMFREFYIDTFWKDTFVRFGRQQIVWGKTDAFRLQDVINPIDFSYHNVIPSLEDRRIPVLALDVIQSLGEVGPVQDVSLEFAWVWDRFIPDQFGQCGEPWAFTAACEARADAGGHQLFNFSLAGVDKRSWSFSNTQPGARIEFRLPEPSISFSFSVFYGFQKTPAARFTNYASASNPNSASMLFLQGLADASFAANPVAGLACPNYSNALGNAGAFIDCLASLGPGYSGDPLQAGNIGTSTGVWLAGFDPYARAAGSSGAPVGTLAAANVDLLTAWGAASAPCVALPEGDGKEACAGSVAALSLPWTASEATLYYPKIWSIGGSLDYQIPGIDTIVRLELAGDVDRAFVDTNKLDMVSRSDVFKASVGVDRSTFIPFINPDRTAFLSFQTFVEHIVDYKGSSAAGNDGMVPNETNVISTFYAQNYWRNDSIVLTNLVAVDWKSQFATLFAPQITWVYNSNISFDFGVNLLWGGGTKHNLRDLCADSTLSCLGDPTTWQQGQWQMLNGPARRTAQAPFWGQQSFADKFMRRRDEFWVGATYQF